MKHFVLLLMFGRKFWQVQICNSLKQKRFFLYITTKISKIIIYRKNTIYYNTKLFIQAFYVVLSIYSNNANNIK